MGGTQEIEKGCDSFAPIEPWLVTKDEIANLYNLMLWEKINDAIVQDGIRVNFIFNIPFLVSYVSKFMTLLP